MMSYKIFLTQSMEVASQLSELNSSKIGSSSLKGVRLGAVSQMQEYVTEIYHDKGYFCCILMYETDRPYYSIVIA